MLDETLKELIRSSLRKISGDTPGFRNRGGQRQMIATIARQLGLASEKIDASDEEPVGPTPAPIAVVEGPTGTGKTFAYLLAAIPVALARKRPLVISTGTVTLQDQLCQHDLPAVHQRSGLNFKFVLAKGRGRYLCPSKLIQMTDGQSQQPMWDHPPSKAEMDTLTELKTRFIDGRWNGDRDALETGIDDSLWQPLTNDANGCVRQHCPYFSQCPFFSARGGLRSADVIVANHDLVLADLALGGGAILPATGDSLYVFDEAHHLADKAIQHFQQRAHIDSTRVGLERGMRSLSQRAGLFPSESIAATIETLSEHIDEINRGLKHLQTVLSQQDEFSNSGDGEQLWRFAEGQLPARMVEPLRELHAPTLAANKALDKIATHLDEQLRNDRISPATATSLQQAFGPMLTRVGHLTETLEAMLRQDPADAPPMARWVRRLRRTDRADDYVLEAAPIWPAGLLRNALWLRCAGAVLTSATLTSLGNFDHFLRSVGLNNHEPMACERIPSPFDLQANAVVRVPYMRSSAKDSEQHTVEITEQLPALLADGKATLVLFSSRKQMQAVYDGLPLGVKKHISVQDQLPKNALIQHHKKTIDDGKPSVLFGLASLSEGIDLQGRYCEHVIIAKLDFQVPDDPVIKTLTEWLDRQGRNSFTEVSLPNASRKLTQACGRLIRTETDQGVITLLDRRVVTQHYGRQLLKGLPPYRIEIEPTP